MISGNLDAAKNRQQVWLGASIFTLNCIYIKLFISLVRKTYALMKQIRALLLLAYFLILISPVALAQDLKQQRNLLRIARESSLQHAADKAEAIRLADSLGLPVRQEFRDGRIVELMRIDRGRLVYYTTHNAGGAALINSDKVYPGGSAGLNLTGAGQTLGIWDGGAVRVSHNEFQGRVVQADGATTLSDHATHVAGTLVAAGNTSSARGMSYGANLNAHDWNNDLSEMATAAAAGLKVSQHSYGLVTGWAWGDWSGSNAWHWFGDVDVSGTEDYYFGFYSQESRDWDVVAHNAPNYLIVKSAGNDRGEGPSPGTSHYVYVNDSWQQSTTTRDLDGGADGYDCISHAGTSKNVLSVGAVTEAKAMSSFSGWGPTDDGRVKPDIVAKGVSVYSSGSLNNSNYTTKSGTSMSGPMVSGSVGLLLQHQENLHPGESLLSSTLKALVLHSADDLVSGAPGPDYRFGWGLMDTEKAARIMSENAATEGIHIFEMTLTENEEIVLPLKANGGEPLRVTMVWTDVPGTPLAPALNPTDAMLVNDLDMRLSGSYKTTYYPYILDPANPSLAAGTGDNFRDNVEMVHIDDPLAEEIYEVSISHKGSLDGGSQTFSLIVTGNQSLTGVSNPQTLVATASDTDRVDIEWTKNPEEDNVMLVFNTNSGFGIPEEGTAYTPGQSLPGGGTVLYRGSNTSFEHTGLNPATTYYYKAFSYDASDHYSTGRTANATTLPDLIPGPPRQLEADKENHIHVKLSWLSPRLNDGFEIYNDFSLSFGSYIQHDLDASTTYSIQGHTFLNQGYTGSFIVFNPSEVDPPLAGAWLPYEGEKYLACFAAVNGPNNDWLVTPRLTVSEGEWLSFRAKSITAQYGLERFRVGISTTGTDPADFTIISTGSFEEAPTTWTEFTYNLQTYAGQEIHIAIHCLSDDAFAFMLDALQIKKDPLKTGQPLAFGGDAEAPLASRRFAGSTEGSSRITRQQMTAARKSAPDDIQHAGATGPGKSPDQIRKEAQKSFGDYNVYRNEVLIATTSGFSFTDEGLAPGSYSYAVTANYVDPAFESGPSNTATATISTRGWAGGISNYWFDAANWLGTQLPDETQDVYIPGSGVEHFPVISGALAQSLDLIIAEGSSLTIGEDGQLTVEGTLSNDNDFDGLLIQDGGTLLHQTEGVPASVQRHIPFGGWQMIGAPVSEMAIIGSDFAPNADPLPAGFDFYYFDESVADYPWINYRGPGNVPNAGAFGDFVTGRGYLVAYFDGSFASNPFTFKGKLNAGNIGADISHTPLANNGWNLIANPYPSGINWGNLNKSALEEVFAQIYDRQTEEYIPQEGGTIAANQGFFVKAETAGTLNLTNDDRVHGGSYTKDNEPQELLVLTLANDTHNSSTTIRLVDGTSYKHDRRDASKLFSMAAHMPQVYSYTSDEVMVGINSIPYIDEERSIGLGVRIPADGNYALSVAEAGGRFGSSPLYLQNNVTGEFHNYQNAPEYRFEAEKGDNPALFTLWFTQPTNVPQASPESLTRIYTHGQTLYLEFGAEATGRSLEVFDTSGRRLVHKTLGTGRQFSEPLNLKSGIYVVRITSATEAIAKRVLISQMPYLGQ